MNSLPYTASLPNIYSVTVHSSVILFIQHKDQASTCYAQAPQLNNESHTDLQVSGILGLVQAALKCMSSDLGRLWELHLGGRANMHSVHRRRQCRSPDELCPAWLRPHGQLSPTGWMQAVFLQCWAQHLF